MVYLLDARHLDAWQANALQARCGRTMERVVDAVHSHPVQQQTMLILNVGTEK